MSTRKSLGYSFLDRYASLLIGVGSSMVLARLLTPSEMGLYAVTMALLALVTTVRDMGAGQYLLQEKDLTTERIRAVWAVQLGVGAILGGTVALSSSWIASFYGEPGMRDIFLVLAVNYFVNPFGSVTYAWLMREMRYGAVAAARFSSTAVGAVVSIWLAYEGYGAISLAWGSMCATIVNAAVQSLFRPKNYPWLPGLRELRRVLSFGTRVTSSSIINTIAAGAPEFLVGKLQGMAAAGLYSRANGLTAMFARLVIDAVHSVALSLFARESRSLHNPSDSFLRAVSYITALSGSFSGFLLFLAYPIVRTLYGPQWDASVDLVRILAVGVVFTSIVPICSAALLASGAVRQVLHATTSSAVCAVTLASIGASVSLSWLAPSVVLASVVAAAVWVRAIQRTLGFRWAEAWKQLTRSALVMMGASVGPALTFVAFGARPDHHAAPLLVGIATGLTGFLVGLRVASHPMNEELIRLRSAVLALLRLKRARQ